MRRAYGCRVAFHVELRSALQHARSFNLSHEELLATVVEPWLADRTIELGEQEWAPRETTLKILEGPRLEMPELSFGQGWSNAERSSENVTQQVLDRAPPPKVPDAFVVEADSPQAAATGMVGGRHARPIAWAELRERIDSRDPQVAAVILVVRPSAADPARS
jgi:hypothetical protein